MANKRDAIRRRVQELMDREAIYNPDELFFRVHRDFRAHYSVIREEIHNAKAALTVNQAATAALSSEEAVNG